MILMNVALMLLAIHYVLSEEIITLDLQPIASLLHTPFESESPHHRRLMEEYGERDGKIDGLLTHPYNSAVYSSLMEIDVSQLDANNSSTKNRMNDFEEHNLNINQINAARHLSRHEKYQREQDIFVDVAQDEAEAAQLWGRNNGGQHHRNLQDFFQQQEGSEAKDGGLYSEFHSVPLSQGYGTHYVTLW